MEENRLPAGRLEWLVVEDQFVVPVLPTNPGELTATRHVNTCKQLLVATGREVRYLVTLEEPTILIMQHLRLEKWVAAPRFTTSVQEALELAEGFEAAWKPFLP